jgi:hypothetical protein
MLAVIFLLGWAYLLTQGGRKDIVFLYISGRGEQFLLTERDLGNGNAAAPESSVERMQKVFTKMAPERINNLYEFYSNGRRFFNARHQDKHYDSLWRIGRPWFLGLLLIGLLRCAVESFRNSRYLIVLGWWLLTWVPLLATTGISPNRLFLGLPAEMFIMALALFIPVDLVHRYLPGRWSIVPRVAAGCLVLFFAWRSVYYYFSDYINYPNA